MKAKVFCMTHLAFMAFFAYGDKVPDAFLIGLTSDAFNEREQSQIKLQEWVDNKINERIPSIYSLYTSSDDPEIRDRCSKILRVISDRDYLKEGKGYLGIQMFEVIAAVIGDEKPRACISVTMVVNDSPAAKAGLLAGDLIVALDDQKWYEANALPRFMDSIAEHKPLDKVILKIKRDGEDELIDFTIVLGKRPLDDLRGVREGSLQELDEIARENHFKEWLKKHAPE